MNKYSKIKILKNTLSLSNYLFSNTSRDDVKSARIRLGMTLKVPGYVSGVKSAWGYASWDDVKNTQIRLGMIMKVWQAPLDLSVTTQVP